MDRKLSDSVSLTAIDVQVEMPVRFISNSERIYIKRYDLAKKLIEERENDKQRKLIKKTMFNPNSH